MVGDGRRLEVPDEKLTAQAHVHVLAIGHDNGMHDLENHATLHVGGLWR